MFDVAEAVDRDRFETSTRVYEARMVRRCQARAQLRSSRLARLLVRR